jgi:hypothetical protein
MQRGVYHSTTLIAVALLLLFLFVSVGYFFMIPMQENVAEPSASIEELEQNRITWTRERPLSFRYVVQRTCYCSREFITPYVVTDRQGQRSATFLTSVESGSGDFLDGPSDPIWISDIFDLTATAIDSNDGAIVEVRYDRRFGYPEMVNIDSRQPDGDMHYEVRDFEVIEPR